MCNPTLTCHEPLVFLTSRFLPLERFQTNISKLRFFQNITAGMSVLPTANDQESEAIADANAKSGGTANDQESEAIADANAESGGTANATNAEAAIIHTQPSEPASSPSPLINSIAWGRIDVHGMGEVKDVKLWPGGGRVWDWGETGTKHNPGIQIADVEELLSHGAQVVVLSRGMQERLGVADSVAEALEARGVTVHVAETRAAVAIYNGLISSVPVGGLFHSTC